MADYLITYIVVIGCNVVLHHVNAVQVNNLINAVCAVAVYYLLLR